VITYYLQLQYKLQLRRAKASGIPLWLLVGMCLGALGVWGWLCGSKPYEAFGVGILVLWQMLQKLGSLERNEFLFLAFGKSKKRSIRAVENTLVAAPFAATMLLQKQWLFASSYLCFALVMALFHAKKSSSKALPTPFGKRPFEFASGFRSTWFLFPICMLSFIAAKNFDNVNYALFGLILSVLTILNYFNKPEAEYFVWNFALSPASFLWYKIKTTLLHTALLLFPQIVLALFFFPQDWISIGIIALYGFMIILAQLLAKYITFPNEIGAAQTVYVGLCIWFPPMVVVMVPYLFSKAAQNLSRILV
jgi:hypothetical protein